MKKKIAILLIAVLILSLTFSLVACNNIKSKETEYTVGNGKDLTIGVISDTQLPGDGSKGKYYFNYVSALQTMKDKGVDTIMFVGDLGDVMTTKMSKAAAEAWTSVFGSLDGGPIKNYIMGNHDFWLPGFFDCWDIPSKGKMQKRFTKGTGEKPYSHKVINGYHFINASPSNGKMGGAYDDVVGWIKAELDKAVAKDPTKPIFVNTHNAPLDTMVSSFYGEKALDDLYKQYPQVVSISGHSHASLMSERTIWQGEYTALQTQSLSYSCFEDGGLENLVDYEGLPAGMIIKLKDDKMTIDRIDARSGKNLAKQWSLDLPIKDNLSKYSDATRTEQAAKPTFAQDNKIILGRYNAKFYIGFAPASTNDVTNIRLYKVKIKNSATQEYVQFEVDKNMTDTLKYLADFFEATNSKSVLLELDRYLPSGNYQIEITAVEEFGKESDPLIGLVTVD